MRNGTRHNLARIPLRWMIRQCFLANTGIRFPTSTLPNVGLDPASLYPIVQSPGPALDRSDIVEQAEYDTLVNAASAPPSPDPSSSTSAPSSPDTETRRAPPMPTRSDSARTLVYDSPSSFQKADIVPSPPTPPQKTTLARLRDPHAAPGTLTEAEEDLADALSPAYDQLALAPGWWTLEVLPMSQRKQDPHTNEWKTSTYANMGRGREIPIPSPSSGEGGKKVRLHRSVDVTQRAKVLDADGLALKRAYKPRATGLESVAVEHVA